jgi:methionyl-tRNA synthetase
MAIKKTFYVTTAIDYVNAEPHIGHAYQKIVADVLARWSKLQGKDTFFLTGTDEHGKKIANSAEKSGKSPQEFADEMAAKFEQAWKKLNIKPNRFIRTTDKDHEKTVSEFVKAINKNKDIYKGKYEGYYCTACETYYTEKDLIDGCCPVHKTKIELLKEESYFFRLSKYQKFLLELYEKHPEFVLPKERRNEIINRVKEGLNDLSITRTSFSWGIPFPLDKKHIIYVWFDALINYYTAINNTKNKRFWPADVHLLGKDNGWFHAVIWPAMLKSAGIELPKAVFIHGFLTFNGEKIAKSLGNVISPNILVDKYGADSVRYFVLRQVPFGEDGDFDEKALIARHNNELADKLGNLISRVSTLAEKYGLEKEKPLENKKLIKQVSEHIENYEFDKALNEIFAFIDNCDKLIQENKPWVTRNAKFLYQLSNAIKDIAILLSPFIPETCEKIAKTFNFEISIKALNEPLKISKIKKSEILFKKIEPNNASLQAQDKNIKKPMNVDKIEGIINMSDLVSYNEFAKLDLRVATIKKVDEIEGADKLYKIEIEIGKEKRTIVAGIKQHYKKDELKDKQVIVICNLEPRKMKGIESQGMLLAAVSEDESKIILLSPEKKIESGSRVR